MSLFGFLQPGTARLLQDMYFDLHVFKKIADRNTFFISRLRNDIHLAAREIPDIEWNKGKVQRKWNCIEEAYRKPELFTGCHTPPGGSYRAAMYYRGERVRSATQKFLIKKT